MPDYYRLDGTHLSVREFWRIAPSPLAFLVAVLRQKLLRLPLQDQPAVCRADRLHYLPATALPPVLLPGLDAATADFAALGFTRQFLYRAAALGRINAYAAAFLSPDGQVLGVATVALNPARPPAWEPTVTSRLDDGRLLSTTVVPQRFDLPPGYEVARLVGRPLAALVAHQRAWLGRHAGKVRPFAAADLEPHLVGVQQRQFDFQVARGVYIPVPVAEAARLRALWQDDPDEGREPSTGNRA